MTGTLVLHTGEFAGVSSANARMDALSRDVTSGPSDKRKIDKAAKDFEGVLLTMLFQKMEESVSSSASEDETCGGDTLRDLGVQELASAVSRAGGIGISKIIASYLERQSGQQK